MRSEVKVTLSGQTYVISLEGQPAWTASAAQQWLDAQFVALQCEPLRASGKLLTADKVVVVAREAGAQRLQDPQWSRDFAAAASAALARQVVQVDADGLTVSF